MDLTQRKKKILRAIIDQYITTAEPVSSKSIAVYAELDISSATIRNEMADLEHMGFLEQPHTSAGRIPTARGYRLYVNELMAQHRLSLQEAKRINAALHIKMQELDRVISEAGRVVSQLTKYPAFSLSSGAAMITIRRFDVLMLNQDAFIVVLMTDSNVVKTKLIRIPSDLDELQLQLLNRILNASFAGLTLTEITPELARVAEQTTSKTFALISLVVSFAIEVLEEQETRSVHTAGVSHLLEHPEYRDVNKAQQLLSYLSESSELSRLSIPHKDSSEDPMVRILIGPENVADALKESSVVMASYDIGDNMQGLIGVVGPTRMDYARVAARLSYLADGLSRLFHNMLLPGEEEK